MTYSSNDRVDAMVYFAWLRHHPKSLSADLGSTSEKQFNIDSTFKSNVTRFWMLCATELLIIEDQDSGGIHV